MTFIRTRTINGRVYRSREERYWCPVTKKVKSRYLGRADDEYERVMARALRSAAKQALQIDDYQRKYYGMTGAERAEKERSERTFNQAKFLSDTAKGPAEDKSAENEENSGKGDEGKENDMP